MLNITLRTTFYALGMLAALPLLLQIIPRLSALVFAEVETAPAAPATFMDWLIPVAVPVIAATLITGLVAFLLPVRHTPTEQEPTRPAEATQPAGRYEQPNWGQDADAATAHADPATSTADTRS